MIIQHNIPAFYSLRNMNLNKTQASKSLEKLASGFKINRAADDAAGLAISEKMRMKIRETRMCQMNVKQGIDVGNTADGGLNEISAMLVRARELCVAASNGTYTDEDRVQIEKEVQALFEEINRVTEYTNYNEIKVLRAENTSTEGLPIIGYEYVENVSPIQELVEWGLSDIIESPLQIFDLSEPATKAAVTFTLDSSIDLNDAKTLSGKSITINNARYNFTTDTNLIFSSGYTYAISPSSTQTVEQFLKTWVTNNSSYDSQNNYVSTTYRPSQNLSDVSVDTETEELTFYAPLTTLDFSVNNRGQIINYSLANGNGATYNNRVVYSDDLGNLRQVNGNVGAYNRSSDFTYGTTASGSFTFTLKNNYTAADIDSLIANTLYISGSAVNFSRAATSGSTYRVWDGMNRTDMETLLKDIFAAEGVTVNSTSSSGSNFTINGTLNNAPASWGALSLYETPSEKTVDVTGISGFSVRQIQSASSEAAQISEITIPSNPTVPGTFLICGYSISLYNSDDNPAGHSYSHGSSYAIDVKGLSADGIRDKIIGRITDSVNGAFGSSNVVVTSSGNKVTLSFKKANTAYSVTAAPYNNKLYFRSSTVLRSDTSSTYFNREASLQMQLAVDGSNNLDISNLVGTGFTYQGYTFEFYNGGTQINSNATNINLSGRTTLSEVAAAMQTVISSKVTGVTVAAGSNGQVTLKMTRSTLNANTYINGNWQYDGMLTSTGESRKQGLFTGGIDASKPGTSVDFSSVNADNLDELLGTGFRIACASCENEYVNILFRWDNDTEPVPPNFRLPPPNDDVLIHNYVVELSKVSDPAQIVSNIVSQLTPVMQHFSGLRVDPDNPAVLIIEDKRYGDLPGNQRGSLIPGLFTDFTYSVTKEPIYGTVSGEVEFREMPIYVSSIGQNDIPLHLPNMSLATLHLYPPKLSIKSVDDANVWLERVDKAAISVSKVRGVIGADINRLEKAYNLLTNTEEHTTAAEATIRDVDMAQEMMKFVKDRILIEASQSMLAQANQLPQSVISLLR